MKKIYNDNEYLNIVDDILYNKEFRKIDGSVHHGLSRLDHSLRVSYYSYRLSKILLLNTFIYNLSEKIIKLHNLSQKEDKIDYSAGIVLNKKTGDAVKKGEVIATLYANNKDLFVESEKRFLQSTVIGNEKPVLRPLIAFDKLDIIAIAEKIGTYETSILPYEDCCTVFLPRFPLIRPQLDKVEKFESKLDVDGLIKEAMSTIEKIKI